MKHVFHIIIMLTVLSEACFSYHYNVDDFDDYNSFKRNSIS